MVDLVQVVLEEAFVQEGKVEAFDQGVKEVLGMVDQEALEAVLVQGGLGDI